MCVMPEAKITCAFEHHALVYEGADDYLAGCREFIEGGLARGERVLVSIPAAKIEPLRAALNGGSHRVEFWNMNEVGRNPGRIIPAVREWVDRSGGRCRFIGEPIWPGRTAAEIAEATRHAALINLAFADADAAILCPYDATGLDPEVVLDAERTHPDLVRCARRWTSERYAWWNCAPPRAGPSSVCTSAFRERIGPSPRAFIRFV